MSDANIKQTQRHAPGTKEWVGRPNKGCWHARVTMPDGSRPRIKLTHPETGRPLDRKDEDKELAQQLAIGASLFVRTEGFQHQQKEAASRMTVRALIEFWVSGKMFAEHGEVNKLRLKKSARDDQTRLERTILKTPIADMAVADVTDIDIEKSLALAAKLAEEKRGKPWRQAEKKHVFQATRRVFDLAVLPMRLRTDNPVSSRLAPRKGSSKIYSFLYPKELLQLLGCRQVHLGRRVYYALAVYTGLRKSSLGPFTLSSLDFENNTITSLVSKTGLAQIFAQNDPTIPGLVSLMIVLKRWVELYRSEDRKSTKLVHTFGANKDHLAQALRDDLRLAGVTREALFATGENIEPLRFHDLRATFVTWAKRAGKGDGWISDRTGHLTKEMIDRYSRGARLLVDLQYEPFPDLSTAIPELAYELPNVIRLPRGNRYR